MTETYTTRPGEMLDLIVWRRYGRGSGIPAGAVEQVMAANVPLGTILARPILPPRTILTLPDLSEAAAEQSDPATVKLWD